MASSGLADEGSSLDPFGRLQADPATLRREAEQQEEFKRSQDEATQRRMAGMIQDQTSMPMTINEVRVHGAPNLRRSFLDSLIKPLVDDSPSNLPSTVGEVTERLRDLNNKLNGLQIFRAPPEVYLTTPDQTNPSTTPTDVDVDLKLREHSRFKLQTGTDVGNGEGSAYGSLLWRNILGGAEMLTLNARSGTRTRSAYSANLSAPINSNPDTMISIEGVSSAGDKPWASHEEVVKGGSLKYSWLNSLRDTQTVEYTGAWRQVTGLGQAASPTVRGDAGDTVKSSLRHTYLRDRRDNPQLPQSGYMYRSSWELAGVGPLSGDVSFSKSEFEVGGALPLSLSTFTSLLRPLQPAYQQLHDATQPEKRSGVSIGGGFRFGMLYPMPLGFSSSTSTIPHTRINDRFQLGGPTDVRGFKLGGIGPHDGTDSVGGDVFAAGSVNMLMPLPYKGPDSALRFQIFANGGRLVAMKNNVGGGKDDASASNAGAGLTAKGVRDGMLGAVGELFNGAPSMAAGVGLVYAHPVARFELNFSLPLVLRKGELGAKGLQVGVGINFL